MQFKLKNQNVNKIDSEQKKYINEFTNLINDESYNKVANCNICDGRNFLDISKKDRWNLDIYTKLCRDCGYLFTNPLLNDEIIKTFYQSYFRQIYKKFTTPTKEFYESEKHRGIEIINYLTKNNLYNKKSKSLDVGCGSGATSYIFSKFFESSTGCDENKKYTSNVEKSENLKILNTNIHDKIFDNQKFDFINYCHVFEHLNDPKKELKRIKELLSKDGILYIEVPGIKHIDRWDDGDFSLSLHIGHTQHFTLKTLINFMKKNNFKMLCGDEIIRSIWKIDNNNNEHIITNEFEDVLNEIKKYDNYFRIKYIKLKNFSKKEISSFLKLIMKFTGIFKLSKFLYYKFKGNKFIFHNKNINNIK